MRPDNLSLCWSFPQGTGRSVILCRNLDAYDSGEKQSKILNLLAIQSEYLLKPASPDCSVDFLLWNTLRDTYAFFDLHRWHDFGR